MQLCHHSFNSTFTTQSARIDHIKSKQLQINPKDEPLALNKSKALLNALKDSIAQNKYLKIKNKQIETQNKQLKAYLTEYQNLLQTYSKNERDKFLEKKFKNSIISQTVSFLIFNSLNSMQQSNKSYKYLENTQCNVDNAQYTQNDFSVHKQIAKQQKCFHKIQPQNIVSLFQKQLEIIFICLDRQTIIENHKANESIVCNPRETVNSTKIRNKNVEQIIQISKNINTLFQKSQNLSTAQKSEYINVNRPEQRQLSHTQSIAFQGSSSKKFSDCSSKHNQNQRKKQNKSNLKKYSNILLRSKQRCSQNIGNISQFYKKKVHIVDNNLREKQMSDLKRNTLKSEVKSCAIKQQNNLRVKEGQYDRQKYLIKINQINSKASQSQTGHNQKLTQKFNNRPMIKRNHQSTNTQQKQNIDPSPNCLPIRKGKKQVSLILHISSEQSLQVKKKSKFNQLLQKQSNGQIMLKGQNVSQDKQASQMQSSYGFSSVAYSYTGLHKFQQRLRQGMANCIKPESYKTLYWASKVALGQQEEITENACDKERLNTTE